MIQARRTMSGDRSLHAVALSGTSPTPLASYLKALGVLRLVSEQVDTNSRGYWRNDHFVLLSPLDTKGILRFFRDEYSPSAIVAPWGGRSGFYSGSSEKSARQALDAIAESTAPRLETFRRGIREVRSLLVRHGIDAKPKESDDKLALLRACRAELPDEMLGWLDACYVLTTDDRAFPPLLGTGGNEGSASYVSNFAQAVIDCVLTRQWAAALEAALFSVAAPSTHASQTAGQFAPATSGGVNASAGYSGGATLNPWDLLLCLEGTLLFSVTATRRMGGGSGSIMSAPFTVRPSGSGSGALSIADEGAARAEMWMPLWSGAATVAELSAVLGEGRVQYGRNRARQARNALDFARAAATLGVQRGIDSFQRYSVVQRLGKNMIAVPVGRLRVERRPAAELIDRLDAPAGFRGSARSAARNTHLRD